MSTVAGKNKKTTYVTPPELLQKLQLINSYERTGKINQAITLCNELLPNYSEHPVLLHCLGVLNLQANQPQTAIAFLERAVRSNPSQALSLNYLGIAHCQMNELDKGIEYYKQAIKTEPTLSEACYHIGVALMQKNDFVEAEKYLRKALKNNFPHPGLYYNLGFILHQRNETNEAIQYYKEALKLNPNYIICASNLGETLVELSLHEEAKEVYEKLLNLKPDQNILEKLGIIYSALGEYKKSVEVLAQLSNKNEVTYYLLAIGYGRCENYLMAIETMKEGLTYFPENLTFLLTLISFQRGCCDWQNYEELRKKLVASINNEDYLFKYAEYYIFGFSLEEEMKFARKIGNYYQNQDKKNKALCKFTFKSKMNKKLRVGYLSANVRSHANAYTITNLFPNHDNNNFEIFLYSAGKTDESPVAKELMSSAPHFVDLHSLTAADAAKKIYKDEIDILVDFTGYNNQFSSTILSFKPAKVQIGFMGHCGTRGADFIDYIFIDQTVVPLEDSKYFYEKLIYLPDTFFICSDKIKPQELSRKDFEFPEDKLILTCFNHPQKYEPSSFDAWMKILGQLPNAILLLWMDKNSQVAKQNVLNKAAKYGLKNQVFFTSVISKEKHLGRLKVLDLFLDSFECTAQSTAIDALSVGLPIVTLYGNNVASRGASSILKALDMPELIAYSVDEYIEKSLHYAKNPEALKSIREKIISNKSTKPLFNSKNFVGHLETAYRKVKEQYESGVKENLFI